MSFVVEELRVPPGTEGAEARDFAEMTDLRNEVEAEVVGNYELAFTPDELRPVWSDPFSPKRLLVARVDGRIVARGVYEAMADAAAPEAWGEIQVLPAQRGQGIGTDLLERIERMARDAGRTTLQGYFPTRADAPGDRLPSPTGFGSVPLGSPGTRFALAHGYSLEQVDRFSRLSLPLAPAALTAFRTAAAEAAGTDYRVVTWEGRTPEDRLADIAVMNQRMSTDAPAAGLSVTEDVWTAERVREADDRDEASPRRLLTAAIEHVPSGRLVAFTVLSVPPEASRPVAQDDTLVLREHRGHRLGMLAKVANLEFLEERHPGHPAVTTFNAEENRHMLSVNEAIGFVAVGYEGAWRKQL
jgi:GNAT superfamily N-acetyltransferase